MTGTGRRLDRLEQALQATEPTPAPDNRGQPARCPACGQEYAPGVTWGTAPGVAGIPDGHSHQQRLAWLAGNGQHVPTGQACPHCGADIDDLWHAHQMAYQRMGWRGLVRARCPHCQAVLDVPRLWRGVGILCDACQQPCRVVAPFGHPTLQPLDPRRLHRGHWHVVKVRGAR